MDEFGRNPAVYTGQLAPSVQVPDKNPILSFGRTVIAGSAYSAATMDAASKVQLTTIGCRERAAVGDTEQIQPLVAASQHQYRMLERCLGLVLLSEGMQPTLHEYPTIGLTEEGRADAVRRR